MVTALVTGITGQDGSYLAELLLQQGHAVHGYVRPDDDRTADLLELCPDVTIHTGELDDQSGLRQVFERVGPDEIYHLAGASSVAQSWERPLLTQRVNAAATGVLLDTVWRWAQESGQIPRLIHASSSEVFGTPATALQNEDTPIRPTSPYGATKAYAQLLVGVYRARGLHACNAILFNHESPRRPPTFVTRKITQAAADIAAGRADRLVIGNLDARRDWGWAPDYVAAMVAAVRHRDPDDYVVATGESHSVREFVAAAFGHVGLHWPDFVHTDPALLRPTDPAEQRGDSRRARDVLNWSPSVGFAELVSRMVDADR